MPRLVLITASSPEIRKVRRSRVLNFQQITMPYLAARVPAGWHVSHMDEEAEEIDLNVEADVVGLTFHTPSALHAYDMASRFRSRGICVVMGGPHVTLLPEEAGHYADAIFIGDANKRLHRIADNSGSRGVAALAPRCAWRYASFFYLAAILVLGLLTNAFK